MNTTPLIIMALLTLATLTGCKQSANVASRNISKASDNFEVQRRIVFFNGITNEYLLEVVGKCSITADREDRQLEVTCKYGPDDYRKHFFGLADNTPYLVEQIKPISVSQYHTRVVFRPQTIIPDIDFQGSVDELLNNKNTDG